MGTARTLASQTQNQQEITNDEGNLNDLEAKADSLINSGQYGRGRGRGSRGTSSYWQQDVHADRLLDQACNNDPTNHEQSNPYKSESSEGKRNIPEDLPQAFANPYNYNDINTSEEDMSPKQNLYGSSDDDKYGVPTYQGGKANREPAPAAQAEIEYSAENEEKWLFAKEFTSVLSKWTAALDSYSYNESDQDRINAGTDCCFIVEMGWYNQFSVYFQLAKAEEPKYNYYGNQPSLSQRKSNFMSRISEAQENNYPGVIVNESILKPKHKYICDKEGQCVVKGMYKIKNDTHYKQVPRQCWDMITERFEYDHEICRPRDNKSSFMNKFNMGNKDYLDLCILPPWNTLTQADLQEGAQTNYGYGNKKEEPHRDNDLKSKRIYFQPNESFQDIKVRVAQYLQKQGENVSTADLRFWKLDNEDWNFKNQEQLRKTFRETGLIAKAQALQPSGFAQPTQVEPGIVGDYFSVCVRIIQTQEVVEITNLVSTDQISKVIHKLSVQQDLGKECFFIICNGITYDQDSTDSLHQFGYPLDPGQTQILNVQINAQGNSKRDPVPDSQPPPQSNFGQGVEICGKNMDHYKNENVFNYQGNFNNDKFGKQDLLVVERCASVFEQSETPAGQDVEMESPEEQKSMEQFLSEQKLDLNKAKWLQNDDYEEKAKLKIGDWEAKLLEDNNQEDDDKLVSSIKAMELRIKQKAEYDRLKNYGITEFEVGPIMNNNEAASKAQAWLDLNKPGEGYEFTGEWQSRLNTSYCKFRQQKADGKVRMFYFTYDPVMPQMGKCDFDNKWGPIKIHCPCGTVSYCSQRCMEKDENYHSNKCTYQEQVDLDTMFTGVKVAGAANGVMGLDNLGNTCYMNSAIQCLSNLTPLREYFMSGQFKTDINKDNFLGHKGQIVTQFAQVLHKLWNTKSNSYSPKAFKNQVGEANEMFKGYEQHDSGEFCSWLLDAIHEDLYRNPSKPGTSPIETKGDDDLVAQLFWQNFLKRDSSFITDLFCGQYKSTLVCPQCQNVNITFDPFKMVQLPIPMKTKVNFFFVPRDAPNGKTFQGELNLRLESEKMMWVKTRIAVQANEFYPQRTQQITPYDFVIAVVRKNGSNKGGLTINYFLEDSFSKASEIAVNEQSSYLFCWEIPEEVLKEDRHEWIIEGSPLKREKDIDSQEEAQVSDEDINKAETDFKDELKGIKTFLPVKSLQELTKDNWIKVPIFQRTYQKVFSYMSSNEKAGLAPRLIWLNLDWTMEQVHRYVYGQYMPFFQETSSYEEYPDTTYESIFNMVEPAQLNTDHLQTQKQGKEDWEQQPTTTPDQQQFDIDKTTAPMIVNIANPQAGLSQWRREECRICKEKNCENCPLMPNSEETLREFIGKLEHPDKQNNDFIFLHNLPKDYSQIVKDSILWDACENDSGEEEDTILQSNQNNLDTGVRAMQQETNNFLSNEFNSIRDLGAQNQDLLETICAADNMDDNQANNFTIQDDDDPVVTTLEPKEETKNDVGEPIDFTREAQNKQTKKKHPKGSHKVFALEVLFIKKNINTRLQTDPDQCIKFESHPRIAKQNKWIKSQKTQKVSITDCFEQFRQTEKLALGDEWYCSPCKEHVQATKTIEIFRPPPVMVVQLNRFKQQNQNFASKVEDYIDCPTDGLDISDYIVKPKEGQSYIYDLQGITKHSGGLGGGHYTAHAKNSETGDWLDFNDAYTSKVYGDNNVVSEEAYIFFFTKRDLPLQNDGKYDLQALKQHLSVPELQPTQPQPLPETLSEDIEMTEDSPDGLVLQRGPSLQREEEATRKFMESEGLGTASEINIDFTKIGNQGQTTGLNIDQQYYGGGSDTQMLMDIQRQGKDMVADDDKGGCETPELLKKKSSTDPETRKLIEQYRQENDAANEIIKNTEPVDDEPIGKVFAHWEDKETGDSTSQIVCGGQNVFVQGGSLPQQLDNGFISGGQLGQIIEALQNNSNEE